MIEISLCLIVKDEEKVLESCLESAKAIVDEIIIVDTGSSDRTKEIAAKYTDKIYDFAWVDDFSQARNFSFEMASKDYIMWLDADDIIEKNEVKKILNLKKSLKHDVDVVVMKYHTAFDEHGNVILTSSRGRIFRNDSRYRWNDPIHEFIYLSGNIQYEDIFISHKKLDYSDTKRNLKIYEALESKGTTFSSRQLYYYARELRDNKMFEKAIVYFNKFLDSGAGWVEDIIGACFALSKCYSFLGDEDMSLKTLIRSFEHASPRAEICAEIAYCFKRKNKIEYAKQWFLIAASLEKIDSLGFISNDYWDYIPYIELCHCYFLLGDLEKSEYYNEKASKYKSDSPAVIHNTNYFNTLYKK